MPEDTSAGNASAQRPHLLVAVKLRLQQLAYFAERYVVHNAMTTDERAATVAEHGANIRGLVTNSSTTIPADLLHALPNLRIVCSMGAGYEHIALEALTGRPVVVTHSPGANADAVADHAMALMLAVVRGIPKHDAVMRQGRWRSQDIMAYRVHGKRVGILGLGRIGKLIARRCQGFDMPIAYCSRNPIADCNYTYIPSARELARACDIVFVATPGGPATRHIIGVAELEALGSDGFLINVGRGSSVDTAALIDALTHRRIQGAALDVVEGEPNIPPELLALDNVVLSPHLGFLSPDTINATMELLMANLNAYFAGEPVLTPIPARAAASSE